MKSGGIRRALDIAAIMRAAGFEVCGGCMFETGMIHLSTAPGFSDRVDSEKLARVRTELPA